MIVWNHSTEPAIVVNRLLASWTTLTDEQIELSSTRQSEDVWYESVIKMAEEVKEDDSESSEMYEEACNSESSNHDIFIRAGQSGTLDDKEGRVKKPYDNTRTNHRRPRHALEPDYMLQNKASISRCSGRSAPRARSWHSDSQADIPGAARHSDTWDPSETELRDQDSFARTLPTSNVSAPQYRQASMHGQSMGHNPFNTWSQPTTQGDLDAPPSNSNPFTPIPPSSKHNQHHKRPKVIINMQETVDSSNLDHSSDSGHSSLATDLASLAGSHPRRRSNHPRMPPINIYMPNTKNLPPLSSSPHINQTQERPAHSESNTKGSKPAVADPRFGRILELLVNQQEQNAQSELDRARVTAELEMRHMLAAREKDFADIGRLEKLIMQQQEDQQRANAAWRAERAVLDEQAAKQVQEAKELVEREISAARAAKKAAQKALKFAKADAEKRAKEEIENNARKEKEKADKKLKDRIASYEKLLDTAIMERSTPLIYNGLPICTANGKRCHDATVSSEDMEVPEPSSRLSAASANFPEEMHSQRTSKRSGDVQPIVPPSFKGRHNMSSTAVQAVQASQMRSQSGTPVQPHQQIILLPSNLNRASAKISELQTSLAEFGVVTKFHGSDLESSNETLELQSPMARGVRSSIFWEPPSSGMGSELLETLRRFGWRPPYARSSGKVTSPIDMSPY
jgi:multidrug efflux pump subunit AcrA (membrane-fusion protein)